MKGKKCIYIYKHIYKKGVGKTWDWIETTLIKYSHQIHHIHSPFNRSLFISLLLVISPSLKSFPLAQWFQTNFPMVTKYINYFCRKKITLQKHNYLHRFVWKCLIFKQDIYAVSRIIKQIKYVWKIFSPKGEVNITGVFFLLSINF